MSGQAKHLASISLGIMGAGFAATLPFQETLVGSILQGGFEAGLVGGLADWFAVTALFRHPMGLPIPHTALLSKNRKRITRALVSALENDWLNKESIAEKIRQIHVTENILQVIERELHSDQVKTGLAHVSRQLILAIHPDQMVPFMEKEIKQYLRGIDTRLLLEQVAGEIVAHEYEAKAFDFLLSKVGEWAVQGETRQKLGSMALGALDHIEADGFMQFALKSFTSIVNEDKLGGILQNFMIRGIGHLQQQDNHNRQAILLTIRTELGKIHEHPKLMSEIEDWKNQLINRWQVGEKLTRVFFTLQQKALAFTESPAYMNDYLLPFLMNLLNQFKNNPQAMEKLENWVQQQIFHVVEANHSKIGKLVQENLDKLDDEKLIEMMEDKIGKDLQWIRVNGAVCGFLIGLVLVGIKSVI